MKDIQLIHGDSLQALKGYDDNHFDVAIVDPPYGINVNHNMGRRKGNKASEYKQAYWDKKPPPLKYFRELFRVSKNQIVWGANHFISRMPYDSSCWLMWDKKFSENVSFAQFELAWTSFTSTCKKYDKFPNSAEKRIHPTQKPVKLYEWLLKNYTSEGDLILDTHLGSGSIAIACHYMKRKLIAYEIDAEYYNKACKRFKEQTAQQALW